MSKSEQEEITKLFFWYQICYVMAPLFVKISALCLYKRVFIKPTFQRIVHVMLWVMAAWGVVSLLVSIFECWPVQAFWTKQGTCIENKAWVRRPSTPRGHTPPLLTSIPRSTDTASSTSFLISPSG